MTTQSMNSGLRAVFLASEAMYELTKFVFMPIVNQIVKIRESRLILVGAKPVAAYTDFSKYQEAVIESRPILDSRGRTLAQVKLWMYIDKRQCYREVSFLNSLLRTSLGFNKYSMEPISIGTGDTPEALMEVSVREFEGWLRSRTAGTQFGIEGARSAAAQPVQVKVASMPPPIAHQAPMRQQAVKQQAPAARPATAPSMPIATPQASPAVDVPVKREEAVKTLIKPVVEQVTRGYLSDFGFMKRTMPDRTFDQFGLDITLADGENRGAPVRIWGADLERVVSQTGAKRGDLVEVLHHGSVPMKQAGGGISHKNSFSLKVL